MNQIIVPGPKYDPSLLDFSADINNAFCPTGQGGGQDNSCSPKSGGGKSKSSERIKISKGSQFVGAPNREVSDQAYLTLVSEPNWFGLGRGFYGMDMGSGVVSVEFRPQADGWRLSFIATSEENRGKGLASKALKQITDAADKAGVTMFLSVDPQGKGGLSKVKLFKWYERNGFKRQPYYGQPNKLSEDMIRHPKK